MYKWYGINVEGAFHNIEYVEKYFFSSWVIRGDDIETQLSPEHVKSPFECRPMARQYFEI